MKVLPFTIRLATNESDLARVVALRSAAYGRHLPGLASRLAAPEPVDLDGSAIIFLAEDDRDREPLGTARLELNRRTSLGLERSVALPTPYRDARLAEPTRLAVLHDPRGPTVKRALFKALYMSCIFHHVEWILLAARAPLDRQYESLGFTDIFADRRYIAMAHAGDLPHRVLALAVEPAETLIAAGHPLAAAIFPTAHPDIPSTSQATPP